MEIIHRRSQLVITRAPVARMAIADPTVVDVVQYSPNEVGIIGLSIGTTTLTLWFDDERFGATSREPLIYLVEVIRDPTFEDRLRMDFGKLEKQLQILFPASKVYLIPLQQRLVVKGQARDPEDAARILQIVRSAFFNEFGRYGQGGGGGGAGGAGGFGGGGGFGNNQNGNNGQNDFIVNMLEVPGNQLIMLHVTIAELSRGQLRQLGVDINAVLKNGRHTVTSALGGAMGSLTGVFENNEVEVMVNWLSGNSTARVLARPTLTVLSGHTASFLSGGEFPVPTIVGVGGAQGTSTSFRGFGVSLLVRPVVVDRDWIQMEITPEYSQITSLSASGIPNLETKRAQTTVRLREGQTIVLAGLYGSIMASEVDRIPFLGELPFIGPTLFNAKKSESGENELLIMVTPELVRPMDPEEVPPMPGWYVTPPNDIELYSYAKTEGYPDQGIYQLNPFGWGPGHATEIGYRPFNPASFSSPFAGGGGFPSPQFMGYQATQQPMMQQQPSGLYPGPPVQQPLQPVPMQQPMAPRGIQPIPQSFNGNMMRGNQAMQTNGIQQVNFQQPAPRRSWTNFFRRGQSVPNNNPATRDTNATMPSLESGNDGRLGRNGGRQPQPRPVFQPNRTRYSR
jgi:pilus assembly protein CpaC